MRKRRTDADDSKGVTALVTAPPEKDEQKPLKPSRLILLGETYVLMYIKRSWVYSISTFNDFYRLFLSDRLSWIYTEFIKV